MEEWLAYLLLFGAGVVCGALNVVAGGGSFLTLPILIFLGLPAIEANATNRVGILIQNAGAVWGFTRRGVSPFRFLASAALPSALGSGLGTWLALEIPDDQFKSILAFLMVFVTLWTLIDPIGRFRSKPSDAGAVNLPALALGFFLVGIYGGFVQAGVGFLILAATTLAGLDLVKGNSVKVLSVLFFTLISLSIFVWQGKVVWDLGLSLAAGTLVGGQLGVRWTVLKGHRWVRAVVTAAIIGFAIRLWLMD